MYFFAGNVTCVPTPHLRCVLASKVRLSRSLPGRARRAECGGASARGAPPPVLALRHRALLTARPNTCGRLSMSKHAQKRTRSWEVDVSLEELVSWDVLDQFMGDMPNEPVHPDQSSSSSDAGLGLGARLGSTQLPLHGSQLPLMAPACGSIPIHFQLKTMDFVLIAVTAFIILLNITVKFYFK